MKRLFFLFLASLLCCAVVKAVPAKPGLVRVEQPDGTRLTLRLVGDEYRHYTTTADGYTVVRDQRGYYVYAALRGDELLPTAHVAHDADGRTAREQAFLEQVGGTIVPPMTALKRMQLQQERSAEARTRQSHRLSSYDYTRMRGLIILVEFTDQKFSRDDFKSVFSDMVNTPDYTGYTDTKGRKVEFTGSVHDYYRDNSGGRFCPAFDIVGPVQIDRSKYYPGARQSGVAVMIREALQAADDQVDYTDYDGDNNGEVDMVYLVFAGCGSHIGGNDERLLWPHASTVISSLGGIYRLDGINLGRYACSTEMTGSESAPYMDGIGTICHEFTHVLGLPDFYDVDYEGSGGESDHPGDFDIMASGGYLNDGRTPCGYTLFERYIMGFTTPTTLDADGDYELENLYESGTGMRLNSPNKREYFLLENRQRIKWDGYVPAHGLLVYRVDSTNATVWITNGVNNNPKHMYFELLRAGGTVASTAFPGRAEKTELSYASEPAHLTTWSGLKVDFGLENIREDNGIVSFQLSSIHNLRALSLPAEVVLGIGQSRTLIAELSPSFALTELSWTTDNDQVATVDDQGNVTGVGLGECHIVVTADNGMTATAAVTIEDQRVAEDIAQFKQLGGEAMLRLTDAQVTYVYGTNVYLRDASAAIVLSNCGFSLKAGNVLNGSVFGAYAESNKMPQFMPVGNKTTSEDFTVASGSTPRGRHVWLRDLTEADYADMVVVDTVRLVRDNGVWAVSGSHRARLNNSFGLRNVKVPSTIDGKYFSVTAIFGTNMLNGEVIDELKLLKSPTEVPAPSGISSVTVDPEPRKTFNLAGQRVADGYRGIVVTEGRKVVVR